VFTEIFHQLSLTSFNKPDNISLTSGQRRKLLNIIITYYQLHLTGFGEIKSLDVLQQLFE